MKVVLVNTSEKTGGAAIACRRLKEALETEGVEVKMVVRDKQTQDNTVISVNTSRFRQRLNRMRFLWERLVIWVNNGFSRKNLFAVSLANTGTDITCLPEVREADVIHIHWTNGGFLSLADIRQIFRLGKPVVWTLHDMWMLTGICHYNGGCGHYKTVCENCPQLRFPFRHDLSNRVWKKKKRLLENAGVSFVTCSRWLKEECLQSTLLKQQKVRAIPNAINTSVFRKINKREARQAMNLPPDKQLILFGAERLDKPLKGIAYLIKALNLLAREKPEECSRIEVVIFGKSKTGLPDLPFHTHYIGYVKGEEQVVNMYNAADLYVTPSLEDNLPNTVMEAMACGTPVVGFQTGGIPEMIDHKVNGYVANVRSAEDLVAGILYLLDEAVSAKASEACIRKVETCYSRQKVARQYMQVYRESGSSNM